MTEEKSAELITVDAQLGLEEVAAIKVAEVEGALLQKEEQLRKELRESEGRHRDLNKKFLDTVEDDARLSYPEIDAAEKALKKIFKDHVNLKISLNPRAGTFHVQMEAQGTLKWKNGKTKEIYAEIAKEEKGIQALEDELVGVKKKLSMLPHLERRTKAAVAKAKLSRSKEGQEILKQIEGIELPALPAAKKQ